MDNKTPKNQDSSEIVSGNSIAIKPKKAPASSRIGSWFNSFNRSIGNWFLGIGHTFKELFDAFVKGDWATKLSFLITGFGYFIHSQKQVRRYDHRLSFSKKLKKSDPPDSRVYRQGLLWRIAYPTAIEKTLVVRQWIRGVASLALEAVCILLFVLWGVPNYAKINLQGLVAGKDNSFLILLYVVVASVLALAFIFIHFAIVRNVYHCEKDVKKNIPLANARDDLKSLVDNKFYVTALAVPVLGVIVFTIVPILLMILIAFTNYDSSHMPPGRQFSWVGFDNFVGVFSGTNAAASTVFVNQLLWTLEWAVLATITCYFGGLILALILNSKKTRFRKFWRTCFVITIAVPQFVTLMLIRYFLDKDGVVNNILKNWSWYDSNYTVVSWAKMVGLTNGYDYFPFLVDPTWTKWTVIIVNCWVGFPYLMLIVSGILMNIPQDLYESAQIDGAGKQRMFWCITMPYILQVTGPYLISQFVSNINNFNVIYLLTSGTTTNNQAYSSVSARESDLLVTWLFRMVTGSSNKYYLASVVGIFVFVVTSIITLLTFTQTTKGNREQRFQ